MENDKDMKDKYVCEWCGAKEKIVPTGLCPVCFRFPSAKNYKEGIKNE